MKRSIKIVIIIEFFAAIVFILYWIYFYTVEIHNSEANEIFLAHEKAFPFPDLGYLVPCLLIGAIGLLKKKPYGFLFSLLAASSFLFLTILDSAFSFQQGTFSRSLEDGIMYGIFAVLLLSFAIIIIRNLWMNRKELLF